MAVAVHGTLAAAACSKGHIAVWYAALGAAVAVVGIEAVHTAAAYAVQDAAALNVLQLQVWLLGAVSETQGGIVKLLQLEHIVCTAVGWAEASGWHLLAAAAAVKSMAGDSLHQGYLVVVNTAFLSGVAATLRWHASEQQLRCAQCVWDHPCQHASEDTEQGVQSTFAVSKSNMQADTRQHARDVRKCFSSRNTEPAAGDLVGRHTIPVSFDEPHC